VDVGEVAEAQPLVERTDAAVRDRAGHEPVADRIDPSPLFNTNVDAAVESLSTIAAHFAEAAGDLVWP
jgi:hypothetical protein